MVDKSISVAITAQDKFSDVIAKYQKGLSKQSRETNNFSQKLKGSFLGAGNSLSKFQGLAKSSLGMLTRFAPALAPLGAALSIKEMSASTLEWGKNIRQMSVQSKALGVPLNRLNALSEAAETMGGSGDSVKSAISDISNKQFDAIHGLNPEATLMFKQFGIGIDELKTKRPDELFEKISARLRDIKDESKQATASQIVFGGAAQGLLPTLQKSQDFYDKAVQASEKNFELTKGQQDTLTDLADTAGQLSAQTKAIGLQMATWAAPGLKTALDWMSKLEKASSRAFTDKNDERVLGASYLPKSVTSAIIDARKRNRIQEEKGKQESTVNPWNDIKSGFIPKAGAWLWNEGTSLLAGSAEAATIQGKKGNSLEQKRTELDQGEKAVQRDSKGKLSPQSSQENFQKLTELKRPEIAKEEVGKGVFSEHFKSQEKTKNTDMNSAKKEPKTDLASSQSYRFLKATPEQELSKDLSLARSKADSLRQMLNQAPGVGFKDKLGQDRQKKAWKFFESLHYTPAQVSGILSNINEESRFDPRASGDNGHSFGIGQWQKDRLKYFKPVTGKNFSDSSFDDQLKFYGWEMDHGDHAEGKTGLKLRKDTSAYQSGFDVARYFERPADLEQRDIRGKNAMDWLNAAQKENIEAGLNLTIDLKNVPKGVSVSSSTKSSGLEIKSIRQVSAMDGSNMYT